MKSIKKVSEKKKKKIYVTRVYKVPPRSNEVRGTSREVGPDDDDDDDDFNLRRRYFRGTKRGFDGDKSIGTTDPGVRRRCAATGRGDNPLSAQN